MQNKIICRTKAINTTQKYTKQKKYALHTRKVKTKTTDTAKIPTATYIYNMKYKHNTLNIHNIKIYIKPTKKNITITNKCTTQTYAKPMNICKHINYTQIETKLMSEIKHIPN